MAVSIGMSLSNTGYLDSQRVCYLFGLDLNGNEIHEAVYYLDCYEVPEFQYETVNSIPGNANSPGQIRIAKKGTMSKVFINKFTPEKSLIAYKQNKPENWHNVGLTFHKEGTPFWNSGIGGMTLEQFASMLIFIAELFQQPFLVMTLREEKMKK